jgi:hypothetical protein
VITHTRSMVIRSDTCDFTHTVRSNLPSFLYVVWPSGVTHVITHTHPEHGNQCNQMPISAARESILSWLILESEQRVLCHIKD